MMIPLRSAPATFPVNVHSSRSPFRFFPTVAFLAVFAFPAALAQTACVPGRQPAQVFRLADSSCLAVSGGRADGVEFRGRRAVRLTSASSEKVFAVVKAP